MNCNWLTALVCAGGLATASLALAQLGGSRAGVAGLSEAIPLLPPLHGEEIEKYITIEGRSELRVPPTELRVVMAVTGEAEGAEACQKQVEAKIEAVKAQWATIGIGPESTVVDFIAVLPRYQWKIENRAGVEYGVESKVGYRMQTNLHLKVGTEALAQAALGRAFSQGVTDIIAFDYGSKDLDAAKVKARGEAVKAARSKADVLLTALFTDKPSVINVQEQTTVHYPQSLYQSFVNSDEEHINQPARRDIPFINAYRPKNTYYRGLQTQSDTQPREVPMKPEITVTSTVRLYFQSPAAKAKKEEAKKQE